MFIMTKDNRLIRAKFLFSKLKHQEPEMLWYFSERNNFDPNQNLNQKI